MNMGVSVKCDFIDMSTVHFSENHDALMVHPNVYLTPYNPNDAEKEDIFAASFMAFFKIIPTYNHGALWFTL